MIGILKGKKSYIVAGAAICYGILGYLLGQMNFDQAVQFALGGSGLAALRAGIKNG